MDMLGKLELEIGDETTRLDLDEYIPIGEDLSHEFTRQPSLYAYIAVLTARAEAAWRDAKNFVEEEYASTDREVRQDLDGSGIKLTETRVRQEVMLRRGYQDALEYELDMHEQYLIMRALERAMNQRGSMLISLGAHLRAEAEQTGMMIKKTKDKLDRARGKAKRSLKKVERASEPEDYGIPF